MLSSVAGFSSSYTSFPAVDAGTAAGRRGEASGKAASGTELSEEALQQIADLQKTDREVRQHEQMHLAAGGGLVTSGPSYSYTRGPDGKSYAVAGEVGIDTSKGSTPEETLSKARRIQAAALAPADPSAQDRQVAAVAAQMEMAALQELARERQEAGKPADAGPGDRIVKQALQAYGAVEADGVAGEGGGLSFYA